MRDGHVEHKPQIYITAADFNCLAPLARSATWPSAGLLKEELARATIIHGETQPGFAHLNSVVTYLDRASGRIHTVELRLPEDPQVDEDCVSILSPLGAALLGLAEGADFRWRPPAGDGLDLKVFGVGRRDDSAPDGVRYYRRPPFYPS
jgi:regulator of nucleoside diphosphate kinase